LYAKCIRTMALPVGRSAVIRLALIDCGIVTCSELVTKTFFWCISSVQHHFRTSFAYVVNVIAVIDVSSI